MERSSSVWHQTFHKTAVSKHIILYGNHYELTVTQVGNSGEHRQCLKTTILMKKCAVDSQKNKMAAPDLASLAPNLSRDGYIVL